MRLKREARTIRAMIRLHCRDRHGTAKENCPSCEELLAYALGRLERCPYQEEKPACSHCPIHCYRPAMRERVREVMRYAGPRMLLHHPLMGLRHLIDRRHRAPEEN